MADPITKWAHSAIIRKALAEPILEQGLRRTHFFNGRLLTATDFTVEQRAHATQHRRLSRAIGAGIIEGLEVQTLADGANNQSPILGIAAGMALNFKGQILELPTAIELTLSQQSQASAGEVGHFAVCNQVATAPPSARGIFILVAGPASGYRESTPLRSLGDAGKVEGCGARYTVEGIRFRLAELKPGTLASVDPLLAGAGEIAAINNLTTMTDAPNLSRLRNLLAHLCFGSATVNDFGDDPLRLIAARSPYLTYGALDAMWVDGSLTLCEVPLALVFWPAAGVRFVDLWSVRRRLVQPLNTQIWPLHVGERRSAESEAIFLQFQDQVREMLSQPNPASVTASSRFRYLPAAGYLPTGPGRFVPATFFKDLSTTSQELDGAYLRLLVHQSWYLDPIDLDSPPPIRLFLPKNNPGFLLFMRDQVELELTPPAEEPAPGTPPTTKTGRINVDVGIGGRGSSKEGSVFFRQTDKLDEALNILGVKPAVGAGNEIFVPTDFEVTRESIKVYAEDSVGNRYPAKAIFFKNRFGIGGRTDITFTKGIAHFTIESLPPDTYTVVAVLKGFHNASSMRSVAAGQTVSVSFVMIPKGSKPGGKVTIPPSDLDFSWYDKRWFDRLYLIEKYLKWPWPPPELGPDFDPVFDPPPPEIEFWVEQWTDYLKDAYPESPIDPGDIRIVIDKNHIPNTIPDQPYAYLTFGAGGAYMPVLLASPDQTHDRAIGLDKAAVPGMDNRLVNQMADAGLTSVEMLSAAWSGMVSDITGVSSDAAKSYVTAARVRGEELQGSLLQFDGVNPALADALAAANIDGAIALANAEPASLAQDVQADGFDEIFAQILIGQARGSVPAAEWSLAASALGLKEEEIAGLQSLGISTQGALKNRVGDDATKQAVAAVLNIDAGQVEGLADSIVMRSGAEQKLERIAAAPVTSVFGVTAETGRQLANLGVATVADLTNADADALITVFGNQAKANAAIEAARLRVQP